MTARKREEIKTAYKKLLFEIALLRSRGDFVAIKKKSIDYIHQLGDLAFITKDKESRWFIGYFQEVAWFIFENPRIAPDEFAETQIDTYNLKDFFNYEF